MFLQRLRESLTLALLTLLPFHAFLVTVGTKMLVGPGHAPLPLLALWKEALLIVICLTAALEILGTFRMSRAAFSIDPIDGLLLFLLLLSVVVSIAGHGDPLLYAYGFKYVFVPLCAFLVLRRVPWSSHLPEKALRLILCAAAVIAVYGLLALLLPIPFFASLGYNDLHSLYLPDGPLPAFHQIGGTVLRRMQSVMSGPNQLGLWLLLPWAAALSRWIRKPSLMSRLLLTLLAVAVILTFSRSAWIAATVIALLSLLIHRKRREAVAGLSFLLLSSLVVAFFFPSVLLRAASSTDHLSRPLEAVRRMIAEPFGAGLGAAGPASNRVSDACVFLAEDDDASWASDRSDLCVFLGDVQVQPSDTCTCPFLPENWYLQIGVELGWIGMIAFLALLFLVAHRLARSPSSDARTTVLLGFCGVVIAGLFLHSFEDAAVSFSLWILLAMLLPSFRREAIG